MNGLIFPRSQAELIRAIRADKTQAAFAKDLGVSRSCLSRYESGTLGAPTKVIDHCLSALAQRITGESPESAPLDRAVSHVRRALADLEMAAQKTRGSRY